MKHSLLLSAFLAISAALPVFAGPISIGDSSFEGFPHRDTREMGETFGSWTVTAGNAAVETESGSDFAHTGTEYIFIPFTSSLGGANANLSQTLTGFVPGIEYRCTFYISEFNASDVDIRPVTLEISMFGMVEFATTRSVPTDTTSIGNPTDGNPWIRNTFTFVPTSTTGDIDINVIRDMSPENAFLAFDTFSIVPVAKGRPKVVLKKPKGKRSTTSKSRIPIKGKIKGILPGEKVIVQVNRKKRTLTANRAFRYRARLKPGRNKIKVRAFDIAGTRSKKVVHKVIRN